MAMTALNNSAALMTLNELNKNNSKLGKSLKKVATGDRLPSMGEGASDAAISEKMRVKIRALEQDLRNVQNGKSLLKSAADGANDIVEELRYLKELALNSCNDHNTDVDRDILQKEFDARKAHIDNIATDTNFNGIPLLDGRWGRIIKGGEIIEGERLVSQTTKTTDTVTTPGETTTKTSTNTKTLPAVKESRIISQTTTTSDTAVSPSVTESDPVTNTSTTSETSTETTTKTLSTDKVSNETTETVSGNTRTVTESDTVTAKKVTSTSEIETETTTATSTKTITTVTVKEIETPAPGSVTVIQNGTTEITADGVYEFAPDYTGTLTISAAKVQLNGASSGATLNDVYIKDAGVDDLYIKNLKINNTQDISTIAFDSSTNNTLHILGNSEITTSLPHPSSSIAHKAIINAGGGLSMVGGGSLSIREGCRNWGAKVGSDEGGSCGDISIGQYVNLSVVKTMASSAGAGIGSGGSCGTCGNIYIGTNANVYVHMLRGTAGVAIGSGDEVLNYIKGCGDITIYSGATVVALADCGAGIGTGLYASGCGNITIYSDAKVNAASNTGAGIGTGEQYEKVKNTVEDITIYSYPSGDVTTTSLYGEAIGYGKDRAKNMTIASINLLNEYKHVEGGTLDLSELQSSSSTVTSYEVTTTVTEETETTKTINETRTTTNEYFDETQDTVTTSVYENYSEVTEDRAGKPLIIHTGTKANVNKPIYIEDMRLAALGVKDIVIDPLEKAKESLDIIDAAIDYALDQATTLGAYYSGLEFTESNLTSAHENTTSSESVIRDSDMAREMTEFTKNNIVMQASQAMLSQANKNASSVLNLLQ